MTTAKGTYALSVNGSKVKGTGGVTAGGLLPDVWTVDTTAPAVVSIEAITKNPRNTIMPHLDVTVSEPLDPASFDSRAVTGTQNGGPQLVTSGTTVTQNTAPPLRHPHIHTSLQSA